VIAEVIVKSLYIPENMDMKETWLSVLGADMMIPMSVTITEKTTVQSEWSESVLITLAPVSIWKPINMMLFKSSMTAVNQYAMLDLPKT